MPLTPISLDQLSKVGLGVQRPEDVVVSRENRVWLSDQASAAAEVLADGSLNRVGDAGGSPNGINMDREGRIIIANVGGLDGDSGTGPVQRLDTETGEVEVLVDTVDGIPLVASNYPHVDSQGRIWVTHSTSRSGPDAFSGGPDGFLFRIETDGSTTMLATEILFANGVTLDPQEQNAYVCSTTGCNVLRFPINADGTLGEPQQYGPLLGKTRGGPRRDAPAQRPTARRTRPHRRLRLRPGGQPLGHPADVQQGRRHHPQPANRSRSSKTSKARSCKPPPTSPGAAPTCRTSTSAASAATT